MAKKKPAARQSAEKPPAKDRQEAGSQSHSYWLFGGVLAMAAAVRVWAALDAFWLDEIWSLLYFANSPASIPDFFLRTHHDNNHYLMTVWMRLCGEQDAWWVYRIPSLLAGVGTVALSARIAQAWGTVEMVLAAILSGASFILITYASEARGYSAMGFFALAAFLALRRFLTKDDWLSAVAFWVFAALGFLSHLIFLHFYVGASAWATWVIVTGVAGKCQEEWKLPRRHTVPLLFILIKGSWRFIRCHAVPAVFVLTLYLVDVRFLASGGAPPYDLAEVVIQTLSLAVGGPESGAFATLVAVVVLALMGWGLAPLWRESRDLAIFFAVTIVLWPVALFSVYRYDGMLVRHSYINIVFFLVLMAFLLGRLWRRGPTPQLVAGLLLAAFVLGNARHTFEFLKFGRGQYRAAVEYMGANTPTETVDVMGDFTFRNGTLLRFYSAFLPPGKHFLFHGAGEPGKRDWFTTAYPMSTERFAFDRIAERWAPDHLDWVVLHGLGPDFHPAAQITDSRGRTYRLAREFRYYGLSGCHWALYRPTEPQPTTDQQPAATQQPANAPTQAAPNRP